MLPTARKHRHQRGTALIEFALVLPFLLVVTLTVVDLSRAFWIKSVVTAAAREGARLAAVLADPHNPAGADNAAVITRVTTVLASANLPAPAPGDIVVDEIDADDNYQVHVSTHFEWLYLGLLNYFGADSFTNPQTLTASAAMRWEG